MTGRRNRTSLSMRCGEQRHLSVTSGRQSELRSGVLTHSVPERCNTSSKLTQKGRVGHSHRS